MLIVSVLGFFAVIFLVATIVVALGWMGLVRRAAEADEAARGEQSAEEPSAIIRSDRLSTLSFWDNILARFDFVAILNARLEQAEMNWSVGRVTLLMLLCGTVTGVVLARLLPGWAAWLAGAGAAFAPYAYILRVREKRFRKFRELFPDVMDSLARALRAGYAISAAFEAVANEAQPPVAAELKRVAAEVNLGLGWQRALENLSRRVPILEVNLFGAAVVLHSRTGGKLSEVIADVAETMREGLALQGEVRSLAAHGKLTGAILTVLPLGIAAIMMIVSPDYMMVLYGHPTGKTLIAAAMACLVLAHVVIRKLVDIKL
jgi:tight adherence protein B